MQQEPQGRSKQLRRWISTPCHPMLLSAISSAPTRHGLPVGRVSLGVTIGA